MDLGAKAIRQVKYGFEDFLKSTFKRKWKAPETIKIIKNPSSKLWRNQYTTRLLQKMMELCAQHRQWATVTQPLQHVCKQRVAKHHRTSCATAKHSNIDAATPLRLRAAKDHGNTCATATQSNCDAATPMQFSIAVTSMPVTSIAVIDSHCSDIHRSDIYCSDVHGNDIHCSDMLCSDIHCSDIHCSDIHCSDTHCSDIHCSDFQRLLTRKCRLSNFLW